MRTAKMSLASRTRFQSVSDNLNADHGMCLITRPSLLTVVMFPKRSSEDVMKRLIGCQPS